MIFHYSKRITWFFIIVFAVLVVIWLYQADFGSPRFGEAGKNKNVEFGVTFSQKYATDLNLNWQKTLIALLDGLKVKKFRLIAYWDLVEAKQGIYNFKDLDWQIEQVKKRGGEVILVIGNRVPRWPECHWPDWIYKLSAIERNNHILDLLKAEIGHYQNESAITAWQVENEPFLKIFGKCPMPDGNFYKQEVAAVKAVSSKPIIATESGELSTWLRGGKIADSLGISLYRIVWTNLFGYFKYPLPPSFYFLKSQLVAVLGGTKKVFISELQAEPWLSTAILQTSLSEQSDSMNLKIFQDNVAYAKKTGLSPIYFWGAEWWYWLKQQGDSTIWDEARNSWTNN